MSTSISKVPKKVSFSHVELKVYDPEKPMGKDEIKSSCQQINPEPLISTTPFISVNSTFWVEQARKKANDAKWVYVSSDVPLDPIIEKVSRLSCTIL